jgi:hypothetical protein
LRWSSFSTVSAELGVQRLTTVIAQSRRCSSC